MSNTPNLTNNECPGRVFICSSCGHENILGWDRHKLDNVSILPLLTGERMTFFCLNCDAANVLTLAGNFVNLNDNSAHENV